jgi:deazaflavin-dependent oxidoreductase (nitroreductase family)
MRLASIKVERQWLLSVGLALTLLSHVSAQLLAQESQSPTRADLEKVTDQSTVEITTIGRKSGKPHTRPIWFVYDQGHLYLQSGKGGKTDWYQNLKKNPQATLKIDTVTVTGTAKFIADPAETERIHELFRTKYLDAVKTYGWAWVADARRPSSLTASIYSIKRLLPFSLTQRR